ncbi:structure-specific endonuclease subunit SLX4 [Takifugu rubripes]|uniref:structure-specific endonuclease subunit SLX4 n=1 Tax=Takifugu rubripes TaxID=31033 RepID=UPI001145F5B9|nr:structure-specific endonuclease subunit SLX4 [Takifugu rubripes]
MSTIMDDSCQDFVEVCSKLLKPARKKQGEPRPQRKAEKQPPRLSGDAKGKRKHNKDGNSGPRGAGAQPVGAPAEAIPGVVSGLKSEEASRVEGGWTAKDKVLQRMQEFKRTSPQKMVHTNNNPTLDVPPPTLMKHKGSPEPFSSNGHLEPEDSDEALALQLQEELDREAVRAQAGDLMDGGLFFCHICNKELTHMTPAGRTQHVNRCLDESEGSASVPPLPSSSAVPNCPICGKRFKSPKSHSAHLKRCSSDMGVSPAELLQALHRQAEERQNAHALAETVPTKRKGSSRTGVRAKKPRKKAEVLDEKTMVALALSSSLYEQEREAERALQPEPAASRTSIPALTWMSDTGKGKKKKRALPRPPPLLLVQDVEAALTRLQERASALLLCNRPPSPPTPPRCPSSLPGWSGAAPLWQRSSLLEGDPAHQSDLYTHDLRGFFTISDAATISPVPSSSITSASSDCPAQERVPVVTTEESILPPSPTAAASMATEELPVSTQVFRDLMELAEDCIVLSQSSHSASRSDRDVQNTSLVPSGFVQEEPEDQADLCTSDFPHTNSAANQARRQTGQLRGQDHSGSLRSVAFSCLSSDLGSMVNNPQLSDVQLQVDSGDVYFAHSFMLYARCPLLVEMVHENGFGVQEEGMPAAQRILISDIPGQAVFALLQYLYTAHFSIPPSLRLHVLELASRFDLKQLAQLCELTQEEAASQGHDEDTANRENADSQKDEAFSDLLRSMWNEEDEDIEAAAGDKGHDREKSAEEDKDFTAGDGEICEERVNEKELEEIYEFAATQRKKDEESVNEPEQEQSGEKESTNLSTAKESTCHDVTSANLVLGLDPDLDRSYSSLFSDSLGNCQEGDLPSSSCSVQIPQTPNAKVFPELSPDPPGRNLLQSSASVADDLSLSAPPATSTLPVPGESPGQQRDCEPEGFLPKHKSQSRCGLSTDLSPDRQQKKKEPELIVLSDSSSPSPDSPLPHYTQIRPYPSKSNVGFKKLAGVECSPDCPTADQSPLDCSPELSWLIPSTPVQHSKSTSSSSTQTRSSIFRMQLFPKSDTSAPFFSSPDSAGAFPRICSVEGDVLEVNPERSAPHSSTPLHPEIQKHPAPLGSSMRRCSFDTQRRTEEKPADRTEQGSFHLSQGQLAEVGAPESPKSDVTGSGTIEKGEREEAAPSRFLIDMDEPPMAFNDSWGLNDANPGCFSLRLEDSRDSSRQEPPREPQDAGSGSGRRLPPPSPDAGSSPSEAHCSQPAPDIQAQTVSSPQASSRSPPQLSTSLLDPNTWDRWEEEEEVLPLSQRINPSARLQTPVSRQKRRRALVPITPMPHYSDMDTPELKNKLNRFGVRPLPKRQMILKLKEIHRYTHQLVGSDSEDEAPPGSCATRMRPSSVAAGNRQHSCTQPVKFKEPTIPPSTSPLEPSCEDRVELLSASQGSNTSSTAASDESERSNPELVPSSDGDSDSDSGISASQATSRLQDRLQAVRSLILSDPDLYAQILEYRPLVLSQFQGRLKAAGIRLGISKLADYLDSQCITFTTAKPGQPAARRRRAKRTGKRPEPAGENGPRRKKGVPATG